MSRFLLLYRGPASPMDDMTPEQGAEQMQAWGAWMSGVGPALVDPGSPHGARTSIVDDGTTGEPSDQNGYSVVEATDLEAARALTVGHPFLSEGKGRFSVEIFELLPMPA